MTEFSTEITEQIAALDAELLSLDSRSSPPTGFDDSVSEGPLDKDIYKRLLLEYQSNEGGLVAYRKDDRENYYKHKIERLQSINDKLTRVYPVASFEIQELKVQVLLKKMAILLKERLRQCDAL
jgi:hypothetical protein